MGARSWSTPSPPPGPLPPSGPLSVVVSSCLLSSSPPESPATEHRNNISHHHHQQHHRRHHQWCKNSGCLVLAPPAASAPPSHVQAALAVFTPSSAMIPVGNNGACGVDTLAVAAATQRLQRQLSVRQDLAMDLPPCLALPDGEERPYGSSTRLRIRDYNQESEIYRECIRAPPNRTVYDSGEPTLLPFRCNSVGVLSDTKHSTSPSSSSSSPSSSSSSSCASFLACRAWKKKELSEQSARVVLDSNGQPVVMRSKSMSTGSSVLVHHSSPVATTLTVMVPTTTTDRTTSSNNNRHWCPPCVAFNDSSSSSGGGGGGGSKSLEVVKSCVRSLRERVTFDKPVRSGLIPATLLAGSGLDNAAFESSCCSASFGQVFDNCEAALMKVQAREQQQQAHASLAQQQQCRTRKPLATTATSSTTAATQSNSSCSKLANLPVVSCSAFESSSSSTSSRNTAPP